MQVIALEEVKEDLAIAEKFYNTIEQGIGDYFRDCILSDLASLAIYAGIHQKHNGYFRMFSKRFPYAIYYDIKNDTAIIVALLDMRRSPTWIKNNLDTRSV